jgi:histidyl-tRNA synthetase
MKKGPVTPKGFRDIAPTLAKKRRQTIGKICQVLENFGFVPLETPTVEFKQTLTGKYGEEEKLIYEFTDRGGRKLALRYDLTVPLARYVANNLRVLSPSFSRYQIGQVFRGENPQKGRYREFTQFDFDTVGSSNVYEDAKIVAAAISSVRDLGLKDACMLINDRKRFSNIPVEVVRSFDKLDKVGIEAVAKELEQKGFKNQEIQKFRSIVEGAKETVELKQIFETLEKEFGFKKGKDFIFAPTLARGLDYYTSIIFELKPSDDAKALSLGGGGRYDNLIGAFAGRQIPAVGFSFGLDRLIEIT